ncbi:DegT/DnrJ/EryC1/StrS family aminotransferase [Falsarthrobacter nasiphocae]|uniref:dTDP-4-amino-4,6-dideoxygalactose transaminase n=1 Tax=Falsarthrobacter nasiphocae TaxID=189863 RepID=A0AAE3YGA7_9MICC|nr:aminotransferase class V-fold PLP-dependent enzyme [Falsarthrobacter nasiphocae]MDR6891403.1 dTDP-4-amino-4,6-dideoxygalactose transaminase [Falsarthrobacter nasiphocae]
MLPYGRQDIDEADIEAVVAALRSDWLTTGPEVARFEKAISEVAGGASATTVTSGTAALHTAYAAADLAPGDEVVTTPMTFVATQSTACAFGAKMVFADIDPFTGNLDPEAAAAAVTDKTRVIATVDYAGHPVKAPEFQKLAAESGALFLEDAAHSIGSTLNGVPVGQLADLTTFSFFPTKNLTTAEGGAVVTPRADLEKRARNFKGLGMIRDPKEMRAEDEGGWFYEVQEFGLNYRLPDVLCALGTSQIARLGAAKARRQEIHDRYNAAFKGNENLTLPGVEQGAEPMWHLYPLRVEAARRRAIFDELRNRGIGVQVNYIPSYWHPVFHDMGYKRGMCPNAEEFYAQEISLPLFATLADDQVDFVIENVLEIVGS